MSTLETEPVGDGEQYVSEEESFVGLQSRRKFLKNMRNLGLLTVGMLSGYEASNVLEVPEKILSIALIEELKRYTVDNPEPITLSTFGATSRVKPTTWALGTKFHRQHEFLSWHQDKDYLDKKFSLLESFTYEGRIPAFSWRIKPPLPSKSFTFDSHANYDLLHKPYLITMAERVRDFGIPIEISFFEPNINKTPPDEYTDLFRYVVEVFREVGAHNAIFTLYLSAQFPLTIPMIPDYYPGHEWIDKFGFSMYDLYLESPLHFNHWIPGNQGPILKAWPWLKPALEITDGKVPVVISEAGSGRTNDENAAEWLRDFMLFCQSVGVSDVAIFNTDFHHKYTGTLPQTIRKMINGDLQFHQINWGERNWAINANEKRLQAHRNVFSGYEDSFRNPSSMLDRVDSLAHLINRDIKVKNTREQIARVDRLVPAV